MARVIEHVKEHYEVREVVFGRSYKWCPQSVLVECACGERRLLKESALISGSVNTCECGRDRMSNVREEVQAEVVGHVLEDEDKHPWHYDTKAQAEQHLKDEAAHPEDSAWRYNDITSRGTDDERNVQ